MSGMVTDDDAVIFDRRDDPFVRFPNETARDGALSFRARGLLAYMLSHKRGWSFSVVKLAAQSTEGVAAVRTAIGELEDLGYLERKRVTIDGMLRWRYVVRDHRPDGLPTGGSPIVRKPTDDVEDEVQEDHLLEDHREEPSSSLALELATTAAPVPAAPSSRLLSQWFDEFWKVYPRRIGKQAALNAFGRAVKRSKITDPGVIIDGARRYRDDPNRSDEFTKHPTTWLNGGCWEDDPLPARGSTPQRSTQRDENAAMIGRLREKFSGDGRIG